MFVTLANLPIFNFLSGTKTITSGSGVFSAIENGILIIEAWGPGANGQSTGPAAGGGGGGYSKKMLTVHAGDQFTYAVGTNTLASSSTISSVAHSLSISANSGSSSGATPAGGTATGGDTNLIGAAGGVAGSSAGGNGGNSPNGGNGGSGGAKKVNGSNGNIPGGGGGGRVKRPITEA